MGTEHELPAAVSSSQYWSGLFFLSSHQGGNVCVISDLPADRGRTNFQACVAHKPSAKPRKSGARLSISFDDHGDFSQLSSASRIRKLPPRFSLFGFFFLFLSGTICFSPKIKTADPEMPGDDDDCPETRAKSGTSVARMFAPDSRGARGLNPVQTQQSPTRGKPGKDRKFGVIRAKLERRGLETSRRPV